MRTEREVPASPYETPPPPTRVRAMLFDRPIGPWRAARRDACNDAIARRLGSREAWSEMTFLSVGVWMQMSYETDETERDIETARRALWTTGRSMMDVAHTPAGHAMEERLVQISPRAWRSERYQGSRG